MFDAKPEPSSVVKKVRFIGSLEISIVASCKFSGRHLIMLTTSPEVSFSVWVTLRRIFLTISGHLFYIRHHSLDVFVRQHCPLSFG